jgi:hypothetical protein
VTLVCTQVAYLAHYRTSRFPGGWFESSKVFSPFSVFCLSVLMQFLRLSFSGLGRSVPNHHKLSNPVPGWRFVVIWQVFLIVRMLLQFSQIQFPAARRF